MAYGSFSGPLTSIPGDGSTPFQLTINTTGLTTNMYLGGSNGIIVPTAGIYTISVFNKWNVASGNNGSNRANQLFVNGSQVALFGMGGVANLLWPQLSFEYLISLSANDVISMRVSKIGTETASASTYIVIKQIS
jgi:hypothetical protein